MRQLIVSIILAGLLQTIALADNSPTKLKLWRHETGTDEMNASIAAIQRFNQSQKNWQIDYETLPQGSYTESITAAALARQLPCIMDVDQPTVPNFAWAGHLRPLDQLIPNKILDELIPGAKGTYQGKTYSIGQFDVALALFARRSELKRLGIRIATLNAPYSAEEFLQILRKIKQQQPKQFPLDINTQWDGEWIAYGYSPWLQSAGGDLVDRSNYTQAEGILNGQNSLQAVDWYISLFEQGLVEKRAVDDQAFVQGKVVFQYTGSWSAKNYTETYGDDLIIMPPIDFGHGPKIGAGSWQWGISRSCRHPEGAAAFLRFILQPDEIAAMSKATGLVPVSDASAALTEHYRPDGAWRQFYEFSKRFAVARPETPGYPKISSSFAKAMLDIRNGKDKLEALDGAVDDIEYDIVRNRGYGFNLETTQ